MGRQRIFANTHCSEILFYALLCNTLLPREKEFRERAVLGFFVDFNSHKMPVNFKGNPKLLVIEQRKYKSFLQISNDEFSAFVMKKSLISTSFQANVVSDL